MTWKKVGVVGVDSGRLLLTDPAYLQKNSEIPSYKELVGLKKSKRVVPTTKVRKTPKEWTKVMRSRVSQVLYKEKSAGAGAGVITDTGIGDGLYPVYANIGKVGKWGKRVKEIKIDFFPAQTEKLLKKIL